MSEDTLLEDPTNRVVSVFDRYENAEAARGDFLKEGLAGQQIRLFHGEDSAADVDTSAKWFADTDLEIKRYRRALQDGKTVVSVPVADRAERERAHDILNRHGARMVTHFGTWITEVMQ